MNALEELMLNLNHANKSLKDIKCAWITKDENYQAVLKGTLKPDHTSEDLDKFLEDIDFEYDSDYGLQKVEGCVWLKDGTWFERHEYDGSEWWEYKKCPEIPDFLQTTNPIRDNRIVNDQTFATRLVNFIKNTQISDLPSEEEKEYLLKVANKLQEYQIQTANSEAEINYFKNMKLWEK